MKCTIIEHEGCFAFEFKAETMEDAALVTRLGVNATKKVRSKWSFAEKDGNFRGYVVIGKHKRSDSSIPARS